MNFRRLFISFALCVPLCAGANQAERKQSELDALQQRLQTLQEEYRNTQADRQEAADGLRQSERAISDASRQLRQLAGERQRVQAELHSLAEQADATAQRIRVQQSHLAQALRSAYLRGQGDALKFMLNGADPNQTARDLRYLTYLSRAQQAMIETLRGDLAQLAALRQRTQKKSHDLAQLKAAHEAEQQNLMAEKQQREQVILKLSDQIQQQRLEISRLKRDEQNLTQLVERLNRMMVQQAAREAARTRAAQQTKPPRAEEKGTDDTSRRPVAVNTETPVAFSSDRPFSRLKGSLRLPVAGELMNRFGAPREDGGLSWKGLFIRAAEGSVVKVIAAGQVVFSEWLRGFGNIIIVDHGEGYMSLYSNNESLYKQVGERVQPGDAIAAVGNSGGQPEPGLYFEMRHQSRPVNPLLWMK